MNFDVSREVERRGMEVLLPFLQIKSFQGRFVVTSRGRLAEHLQTTIGDVLMNADREQVAAIEIKVEARDTFGNFFLETWSNKHFEPRRPGWIYTLNADLLWYYFLEQDYLCAIDFRALFEWAHFQPSKQVSGGVGRLYDFPEKPQGKYQQRNATWGRCVPIEAVEREVGFTVLHPRREVEEGWLVEDAGESAPWE